MNSNIVSQYIVLSCENLCRKIKYSIHLLCFNFAFRTHPHKDYEIFTYVVDGMGCHKDSMGNKGSLPRGSVQYLSAGTGITHSEMNDSDEVLRVL